MDNVSDKMLAMSNNLELFSIGGGGARPLHENPTKGAHKVTERWLQHVLPYW